MKDDDETVQALIDALEPRPVLWEGHWVCHVRGRRGLGIGKTPSEAHEEYWKAVQNSGGQR